MEVKGAISHSSFSYSLSYTLLWSPPYSQLLLTMVTPLSVTPYYGHPLILTYTLYVHSLISYITLNKTTKILFNKFLYPSAPCHVLSVCDIDTFDFEHFKQVQRFRPLHKSARILNT